LGQKRVATVLLSLIFIGVLTATSQTLYAASLTVNTVTLSDDNVADSDYLLNFSTFTTDHSVRYCVDTYISSDFYLTFTLNNGALWENPLSSSSLSIEGSTVSHAIVEGGSSADNFITFLIHSNTESISSGTCFVIGKNTDIVMHIPKDTPSGTQFQIEVETNLATNSTMLIEPIQTADWVVIRSEIDCKTVTAIPQNECDTLVKIYKATNGPNWIDRAINKWNLTQNPCIWTGIICTKGRVTRITRKQQNLVGTLPKLSAFTKLQIFDLANNQLSGSIPSDLNALTQLQEFNLWGNELTGPIPNLSTLTHLQKLKLGGGNQLSGPIPDLSTLSNLSDIALSGNQLTGNIPKLSTLTQLEILYLGKNQLTGSIPDLSALTQLEILHLQNNKLNGTIPDLKNLTQLQELYLQNNQLRSEIPSSLINLTQLKASEGLNLSYNALTATDAALLSFLKTKNPDWAETQTIPPTLTEPKVRSSTEIQILWEPIPYTDDVGYYQVKYATQSGGPYDKSKTTTKNKKANSDVVTDLSPDTTYYFRVETDTQAHGDQKNDLTSVLSEEVSAHTLAERGPEIDVLDDNDNARLIVNGTVVDFGTRLQGSDVIKTFVVKNSGESELTLSQLIVNGKGFSQTQPLDVTTLQPGESTTFEVRLDTNTVNSFKGDVLLKNTDSDENPFKFDLKGTVILLANEGKCEKQKEIQQPECDALVSLYQKTNGLNWADSPNNQWNDWYAPNAPCNWKGITCTNGRVTSLDRANSKLEGTLPDLSALNRLQALNLNNNKLTGQMPDFLKKLVRLETLDLGSNQLTGTISDLSQLKNIKALSLAKNRLSGSIPDHLSNLAGLNTLHLDNNQLSGNIPSSLVQLTQLQDQDGLDLGYNKLTASDSKLISFLNAKNQGWNQTQTIPPFVLEPIVLSETEVQLRWASIIYQANGGYYQVKYTTESSDEYSIEKTADKKATSHVVKNLLPNTTYIFVVETHTPAHSQQKNALTSKPSKELKARTTQQLGPVYTSTPQPNTLLDMGSSELGTPSTTTATVIVLNQGDKPLEVSESRIRGTQANDFRIKSFAAPFSLSDSNTEQALELECIPSQVGVRTAILTLKTNDPNQSTVSYPLTCRTPGQKTGKPVYDSMPEPNNSLMMGSDELGNPISSHITVLEIGTATLDVTASSLTGPHASDFSIVAGNAPFSIPDNDAPHTLFLHCLPSEIGERTADLSITTNDPERITVKYRLKCEGIGPIYESQPEPGNTLSLGSDDTLSAIITVSNSGNDTLEVLESQISGNHESDFSISRGAAPFSILQGGEPHTLNIQCFSNQSDERTATLTLTTNDHNHITVTYPLNCFGKGMGPVYASEPEPNRSLILGTAVRDTSITTVLLISEAGDETLEVSEAQISGQHQDDFSLLSFNETVSGNEPFSIPDGGSTQTLTVRCTPSDIGDRSATLSFSTNDPNQSTVTYPLSCSGTSVGPVYASEPEPNTPLTIGAAVVNTAITTELLISEAGDETLEVSEALLTGQHQEDFSLLSFNETVSENDLLSIPDGGSTHTLTVRCTPSDIGDRSATLSFSTNDPNQAKVNYPLTCQGLVDEARFTGEIRTQFEAIGNNLTIDSPEKIKLIGRIEPAKQHIGQRANLFFRYQWTPQNGGTTLNIEVTLAEQEPLEEQIEITLFEGWLIGLTGFFKIELGYELPNDELHFDEIATLTIRPNTEPTDLILDGNTVQENSPSNTVIGTFTTQDADKGDRFVYGLIENPNKYFKIKGNELRVSKRLDFETASEYPITVRSVDSNGSYQEKSFIIRVTKAQANPVDIHLTEESVLENTPGNTIIGRFWTEDAEQGNYDYELLEDADGYFMLDEVENNLLRLAPGKQLDFETEPRHNITVRSTERQIGADIEKTFTIKVINVADVIVQGEIRDILTDSLIERPLNATESVKFTVQLIPDKAHHGLDADIICMALSLVNQETAAIYVLEGEQWQEWNQSIALPAVMRVTLQDSHNLTLWQGQFTQGQLNLYVAYRLETGELVYSPEGFEIIFEE